MDLRCVFFFLLLFLQQKVLSLEHSAACQLRNRPCTCQSPITFRFSYTCCLIQESLSYPSNIPFCSSGYFCIFIQISQFLLNVLFLLQDPIQGDISSSRFLSSLCDIRSNLLFIMLTTLRCTTSNSPSPCVCDMFFMAD